MKTQTFVFLGLVFAMVLLLSSVAATETPQDEETKNQAASEEAQVNRYGGGYSGGYGGGYGGGRGGGYGGGHGGGRRCSRWGCPATETPQDEETMNQAASEETQVNSYGGGYGGGHGGGYGGGHGGGYGGGHGGGRGCSRWGCP